MLLLDPYIYKWFFKKIILIILSNCGLRNHKNLLIYKVTVLNLTPDKTTPQRPPHTIKSQMQKQKC